MAKRIASASLWFFAVAWGFNYVAAITGSSPVIGLAIAAAVATFVGIDPLHLFWPARPAVSAIPARDAIPAGGALQTQI